MKRLLAASLLFCLSTAAAQTRPAPRVEAAVRVAFTEGPTVDSAGNVYFSEMVSERILKLSPDGQLSVFRAESNRSNGLVLDPQGRLLACESGSLHAGKKLPPRVTRTDLKTGRVEVLAEKVDGQPLGAPNDITFDGKGRIYFTDQGAHPAVYRIDLDGTVTRILNSPAIDRPNGVIISPDDRTLYLVESHPDQGRARMIRAYDLQPDGGVRNMRVHYNFYPGRSADGMAIDTQGNVYAAAGLHELRGSSETLDTKPGVHVISPAGKLIQFIPIAEDLITNCAFGGPDRKTLYVTAGKMLYRIRTDVPGTPR